VLVGLNAGSEGKGKFMSILQDVPYAALVRTGGPNAAHTVEFDKKHYVYHTIPCGAMHFPKAKLILGANAQIDIEHLKHEIAILDEMGVWDPARLLIDPNAVIIDPVDKVAENGGRMPDCGDLYFHPRDCEIHQEQGETCFGCGKLPKDSAWAKLGSTTHGVGANAARKAARGTKMLVLPGQQLDLGAYVEYKFGSTGSWNEIAEKVMNLIQDGPITDWGEFIKEEPVRYAEDDDFLKQFVGPTVDYLNRLIDDDKPVLLEGTQGSVLSLHHGYRGKTTSRDTNASNWCSDAGISPLAVRDVYGVTRTFPIRVAGNSGPMSGQEITWEEVTEHAESPEPIVEITTATKRKRRVFTLDGSDGPRDLQKALDINRPTKLMLSFVDYLSYEDRHKTSWDSLSQRTRDWITTLESKMGVFFKYLSTGPDVDHTITRKSSGELAAQVQGGKQ
jgi:adenylosuccinate synthase